MAPATLDDAARARIPEAARAHTPQGAEAFARFYLEQVNKAWMAPDPELIRPYATAECKTCAGLVAEAERLLSSGLRYEDPPIEVGPSVPLPSSTGEPVLIQIVSGQLSSDIVNARGQSEEHVSPRSSVSQLELDWQGETWHIDSVKTL